MRARTGIRAFSLQFLKPKNKRHPDYRFIQSEQHPGPVIQSHVRFPIRQR